MRILYLDCFAGISGDMFVGALLDLGVGQQALAAELGKLRLADYRLVIDKVDKLGIQATTFKVLVGELDQEQLADVEYVEYEKPGKSQDQHKNRTENSHSNLSGGNPGSSADHLHRKLEEILHLIHSSELSVGVKARAGSIFERLAEAEGKAHGISSADVEFHEIGGVDAILDIVGAAVALEQLGVDAVYASALHLGTGFVQMHHGLYPVPAPATANLLLGVPTYGSETHGELVTPTGAAILTSIAAGYGPMPAMTVHAVGYGAGRRDREFPNVLRAFLGVTDGSGKKRIVRDPHPEQHLAPVTSAGYHDGPAMIIEANIDDMNPQLYENLLERLLASGALDVILLPGYMKKNRPGFLVQVLAHPESVNELLTVLFTESTTLGARTYPVKKHMLQREWHVVETQFGKARVKVARLGERIVNIAPEYEDCLALAEQNGKPLKDVFSAVLAEAMNKLLALDDT